MPFSPKRLALSVLLTAGAASGSAWHRDKFCAKYDIDARHDDRHSDGLGHGLEVDIDRLVK